MQKVIATFVLNSMLALTLLISGCGKEEAKTSPPAQTATAQAPQVAPPPAPQATATAPTAAPTAAVAPAPPGTTVLATADGDKPGVRVEVQELKRTSGTVMLRFAMINDSNAEYPIYAHFNQGGAKGWRNVSGVNLVDTANKKKYLVVLDSETNCLCSDNLDELKPKSRMNLWARFPAPPDDVQKITVVIPHFMPMDDVPISR